MSNFNKSHREKPRIRGLVNLIKYFFKKKELTTLHKLFPKQKRKKNIPTQSRKFSTKLMPKSDKDISRKVQCNISYKYRCKNHQQHTSKLKPEIHKKQYTYD